jgi:hypothetical protein
MSRSKKEAGSSGSANPANQASMTAAQAQEWYYLFKKLEDNKWVVPAILAAGVAGLLEMVHIFWLAGRFLYFYLAR